MSNIERFNEPNRIIGIVCLWFRIYVAGMEKLRNLVGLLFFTSWRMVGIPPGCNSFGLDQNYDNQFFDHNSRILDSDLHGRISALDTLKNAKF